MWRFCSFLKYSFNLDLNLGISKEDADLQAPIVVDAKPFITVAEYASVEIKVLVKATPKAKAQWSRHNKLIRDNDTFSIHENESVYMLTINKVSMVHKGEYMFSASNICGSCDYKINLDVMGIFRKIIFILPFNHCIFSSSKYSTKN